LVVSSLFSFYSSLVSELFLKASTLFDCAFAFSEECV
jgi:hypothetical protein